ncbi:hypothetical protein CBM2626_B120121 [Cupriavidus taiwanensis]|uniref:Uncharacterized protein n=1 Tax=Cupriavidus taiwanensis TaxID=164546 RepID=A0A375D9T7_9BURK|nr:hypothetical protein CBM2600_B70449 [Cupriavidus taiwanensis]SOZ43994.1 protein of unknown function [Cupriavidus taiwanensis]SOZ68171.1 hypothetical protein CBM2613_B110257 [Cupriavidus taiwanensis]SPA01506.1 hypothetical protein CBM2626_B120121 [Cupriavidus taiwanensis]SPC23185.1 protein of unknown function [Cupriavidus taiwanensis]
MRVFLSHWCHWGLLNARRAD